MFLLTGNEWGMTLGLGPVMRLPARGLHIHHSVTVFDDDGDHRATGDVIADMKEIERIGNQRFGRFSYSWGLHPSGWIGEGAGMTIGAHTKGYNSTSFGICFIGNYEIDKPTEEQIDAFRELRWTLVNQGLLVPSHYIAPHRHRKATSCPGKNVMARWHDLTRPWTPSTPQEDPLAGISLEDIGLKMIQTFRWCLEVDGQTREHVKKLIADTVPNLEYIGLKAIEAIRWCLTEDDEITKQAVRDLIHEVLDERAQEGK